MALSWSEQILPAGTQTVNVEMPYLDRSYIHVYLNGVEVTDFTWSSDTLIRLDAQLTGATTVAVVRRTDRNFLYILFAEGAAFIKENLDTQNTQFLHLSQELVEGRSIDGFFGEINMNGYKITNLKAGTESGDAVNKGQLDEVDTRVTNLEQTFVTESTSYPWYTVVTSETSIINPPFSFTKAAVYINGVCQTPGYSYEVVSNTIMLADPVPAGTHIFARLGEDVDTSQGYATAEQLGLAMSAAELVHATLQANIDTKLTATSPVLVANGGTGATTAVTARTSLGAASSGSNSDITALTRLTGGITGSITGVTPGAGLIGQEVVNTPSSVAITSGTNSNVATITLPAGDWIIEGSLSWSGTSITTELGAVWLAAFNTASLSTPATTYTHMRPIIPALSSQSIIFGGTIPSMRITTSATSTPVFLVSRATFTAGTVTASGLIRARRLS